MKVSVIIVNYNGLHYTQQCLKSFYRFHETTSVEVIVVDNNSSDGSQSILPKEFPEIVFIPLPVNRGFGSANNAGAKKAQGELLFFVNNDTLFIEECISRLERIFWSKNEYGIVGPRLLNEDSSIQRSYGRYPSIKNEYNEKNLLNHDGLESKQAKLSENISIQDWVTGAAFLMKHTLFEDIGGFDENYFMYFEDIDLCKTIESKGLFSVYVPEVKIIHLGGRSYGNRDGIVLYEYRRSQLRYYRKHNSFLQSGAIRLYLILKYIPKVFRTSMREVAVKVLRLSISRKYD